MDHITCPTCKYRSYHLEDVRDRWCNNCEKRIPMYSRRELNEDESMCESLVYREMFLGGVMGVLLKDRETKDPHIIFEIISEDDTYWFKYSGHGASTSWLDDYIQVMNDVKNWCEENAIPDMYEGHQYGWKFPTKDNK